MRNRYDVVIIAAACTAGGRLLPRRQPRITDVAVLDKATSAGGGSGAARPS